MVRVEFVSPLMRWSSLSWLFFKSKCTSRSAYVSLIFLSWVCDGPLVSSTLERFFSVHWLKVLISTKPVRQGDDWLNPNSSASLNCSLEDNRENDLKFCGHFQGYSQCSSIISIMTLLWVCSIPDLSDANFLFLGTLVVLIFGLATAMSFNEIL